MKTGKSRYRSLLNENADKTDNIGNSGRDKASEREKFFEYELTRLARMVSSQRQIYLSLKDNQSGNFPGELSGMDPFWTDPVDLENSYRADQRALQVLYRQAQSEGVYLKDWLEQLVIKSLSDSPERTKTKEKLREILSVFKKHETEGSKIQKKTSSDKSDKANGQNGRDVNSVIQKKLDFARRYSIILESFIRTG